MLALTNLHVRRPSFEALACGCQLDRTRFPGREADPRRRTELDSVRQVHLDPNPRDRLGRGVDHGPGECLARAVETKLETDAATRLAGRFRDPVPNPRLAQLLPVLTLGPVFPLVFDSGPAVPLVFAPGLVFSGYFALVSRLQFRFGLPAGHLFRLVLR